MLEIIFMVIFVLAPLISAEETDMVIVSDDKNQCKNQMIDWCKGMKYPQEGAGMSMVSISYHDSTGYYRIFCSSDAEGTNCTKNRGPWFYCSPDNKFFYKGKPMEEGSDNVDDDMCKTADKAFNDLFVQNMSYDNDTLKTELEKGMGSFFEQMASMQEQIEQIQKALKGIPFFGRNFWNIFEDGFPFGLGNKTTDSSNSAKDSNQIERE